MKASGNCEPLRWPVAFSAQGQTSRFLSGIPFLGADWNARRSVIRQMQHRQVDDCVFLSESTDITTQQLLQIIEEFFEWPTDKLIADDPCEIIFWKPGVHSSDVEALLALCEKFGFPSERLDDLYKMTVGELIQQLRK